MRIFCHVNELRVDGCRHVRSMIAAFDRVVLWGPSFAYFEEVAATDPLAIDGRELLEHIGHGRVRVIARDWWLTDPNRRNALAAQPGQWHGYAWHSLDEELRRIYVEDQGKGEDESRVRGLSDGADLVAIQRLVEERGLDPLAIATRATGELPGYQDKASADLANAGLSLVKDAYNHGNAFKESGADRNLGTPRDRYLYEVFAEQAGGDILRGFVADANDGAPDLVALLETLQSFVERLHSAISPPTSRAALRARFDALLRDPSELGKFRALVEHADRLVECGAAPSSRPLEALLHDQLAEALREPFWTKVRSVASRVSARHVLGLTLSLVAKHLGSEKLTSVSEELMREGRFIRSRKSLPAGYQGPVWPVYLAVDERDPSDDVQVMHALRDALRPE